MCVHSVVHADSEYRNSFPAIILAFVGVKMILTFFDLHIETWVSLLVIALVLLASIGFSLRNTRDDTIAITEEMPPPDER